MTTNKEIGYKIWDMNEGCLDWKIIDEFMDSARADERKNFLHIINNNQFSFKNKFWDDYDDLVRFFVTICKNKYKKEQFMALLDKIIIDNDVVLIDDLEKELSFLEGEKIE